MDVSLDQIYQTIPSHKIIFDYWKDKCITDIGEVLIESKCSYNNTILVITDWGEPSCWGCNKPIDIYSNPAYSLDVEHNVREIWDYQEVRSKLQRCHIQPRALTHNNRPDNIFLLCKKCHMESPDYTNPQFFFKYIYNKRKSCSFGFNIDYIVKQVLKLCVDFNKDITSFNVDRFKNNMYKCANTHGAELVDSTIIAAIVDSMDCALCDNPIIMEQIKTIIQDINKIL